MVLGGTARLERGRPHCVCPGCGGHHPPRPRMSWGLFCHLLAERKARRGGRSTYVCRPGVRLRLCWVPLCQQSSRLSARKLVWGLHSEGPTAAPTAESQPAAQGLLSLRVALLPRSCDFMVLPGLGRGLWPAGVLVLGGCVTDVPSTRAELSHRLRHSREDTLARERPPSCQRVAVHPAAAFGGRWGRGARQADRSGPCRPAGSWSPPDARGGRVVGFQAELGPSFGSEQERE